MKKFNEAAKNETDKDKDKTSETIVNIIANSLNRASNKEDTRGLLMLIAALGLLNISKQGLPLNVARKLASKSIMS